MPAGVPSLGCRVKNIFRRGILSDEVAVLIDNGYLAKIIKSVFQNDVAINYLALSNGTWKPLRKVTLNGTDHTFMIACRFKARNLL